MFRTTFACVFLALTMALAPVHATAAHAQQTATEQALQLRQQGFEFLRQGKMEHALDAYRLAYDLEPTPEVKTIMERIRTTLDQQARPAAQPTPQTATPAAPDADKAKSLRQQGFALMGQGRMDEARAKYVESLQYEDNPGARMTVRRIDMTKQRKAREAVQAEARKQMLSQNAPGMTHKDVADIQRMLADKGYDPGPADGVPGQKTRDAVTAYQRDHGLEADGVLTPALADGLHTPDGPATASTGHAPGSEYQPQPAPQTNTPTPYQPTGQPTPPPATEPTSAYATATEADTVQCEQRQLALEQEMDQVAAAADSMGMCQSSREYQRIMYKSAQLMRDCPHLDTADGAQAAEYQRVGDETQATIDAACQ